MRPITDNWMFLSQIEAFDDFNTISKYTPANPDVKHPEGGGEKRGVKENGERGWWEREGREWGEKSGEKKGGEKWMKIKRVNKSK